MAENENAFKVTWVKVVIAVVLFLIYFSFTSFSIMCPSVQRLCPVSQNVTDSRLIPGGGGYYLPARSVPFSCAQVCTNNEYSSSFAGVILLKFVVPVLAAYILSSLIIFGLDKLRKN